MPNIDFNADGRDDIIWQNTQTGHVTNWLGQLDGSFVANQAAGLDPWASGTLVGMGDFNEDNRTDTLWRYANGDLYMSQTYPDGAFYFVWSMGFVAHVSNDLHVAATGDFDGDGRDDILWRHANGTVTSWIDQDNWKFVNNNAATQAVDPFWNVAGTGDFNGDGNDDILWRHANGTVTNWLGRDDGSFFGNFATAAYGVDSSWHVVGTGDFDGDGRDDVLWRHNDGTVTDWLGQEDGSFVGNFAATAQASHSSWHIVGTGDYDGDGRDDVLWRHDSGIVTNWLGQDDGSFQGNYAAAAHAVDLTWQILPNPSSGAIWDY